MKISVSGFKSICQVDEFELAPITMLAGVNSSGKSSLLQALLLLKQTLESDSKQVLQLNGPYIYAESLSDLMYANPNKCRKMSFELDFSANEIANSWDYSNYSNSNTQFLTHLKIQVSFVANGQPHVSNLKAVLYYENNEEQSFEVTLNKKKLYKAVFSTRDMLGGITDGRKEKKVLRDCTLDFTNFMPYFVECNEDEDRRTYSIPIAKYLMDTLKSYLVNVNFLGPIRVEPVLARGYNNLNFTNVGVDGVNTRFILNEKRNLKVDGYVDETLMEATKRWICDEMKLANGIDVVKDSNKLYRTYIDNFSGSKVDLCQMGFGLSQILPVVVQGLLTPHGGTFVVVDPDVHIHPKVQGLLVDFFIELKEHGRNVVIETHSDHMVTRLRRRIAENKINPDKDVNLCFVTNEFGNSDYVTYSLSKQGSFMSALPAGFLDAMDEDFRAIIMAKLNE